MSGQNGTGIDEKKRHVFLSRASSRKELAATLHEVIVPLLQQHANNLEVARRKIEALEARIAALEPKTEA